ncbi:MAG TPA: hypothetical protein VE011_09780 [Candidatus Dormibacteraeota bacterium]|nr:hypothetical protein [Candidatus Dormibacteraeota bacterium]
MKAGGGPKIGPKIEGYAPAAMSTPDKPPSGAQPRPRRSRFREPDDPALDAPPDRLLEAGDRLKAVVDAMGGLSGGRPLSRIGSALAKIQGGPLNIRTYDDIQLEASRKRDEALRVAVDSVEPFNLGKRPDPSPEVLGLQEIAAETRNVAKAVAALYDHVALQAEIAGRQERSARFRDKILIGLTIVIAIFTIVIAALTWALVNAKAA